MFQWALSAVLWVASVSGAEGSWVEAVGEATIRDADLVEARKSAEADGLRRCVEKVVGVAIESRFASEAAAVVAGDESRYSQRVRDELSQRSDGFIERFEVVREARKGNIIRVWVRARVFESKLRAELEALIALADRAGNPRVALVIHERVLGSNGKASISDKSQFAHLLEQALVKRGLELVAVSGTGEITAGSRESFSAWLDDAEEVAVFAQAAAADVVIVGSIELHNDGLIDGATWKVLEGQTRVRLAGFVRAITVNDARVVSAKALDFKSFGPNFERAVYRALQGRGRNAVSQTVESLISDLVRAFKAMASDKTSFVVELRGITSFRRQASALMDALKSLGEVTAVGQKRFDSGVLLLDVTCRCSMMGLQARILEAVGGVPSLKSIDVQSTDGKWLVLVL